MPALSRKPAVAIDQAASREASWDAGYPTGMVWCPMKMSGMAIMKCARLQRQLGCGSLGQWSLVNSQGLGAGTIDDLRLTNNGAAGAWPWLRRRGECRSRATEEEIRELRHALTPLKLVANTRKNPKAYRCPSCGASKVFGALRCRRCWRLMMKGGRSLSARLRPGKGRSRGP